MRASLYLILTVFSIGLTTLLSTSVHAECIKKQEPAQRYHVNPGWDQRFGAFVTSLLQISPSLCDYDQTEMDIIPTRYGDRYLPMSGKKSENTSTHLEGGYPYTYKGEIHTIPINAQQSVRASISDFTANMRTHKYYENKVASYGVASVADLLLFEVWEPTSPRKTRSVPIQFCSRIQSMYSDKPEYSSKSILGKWHYGGEHASKDKIILEGGPHPFEAHHLNGEQEICHNGTLEISGRFMMVSVAMYAHARGSLGYEKFTDASGKTRMIPVRDGEIDAHLRLKNLPAGVKCYSASESFTFCNEKLPVMCENPDGLINWEGSASDYSIVTAPFAGASFLFHLTSECIDGQKAIITVNATAIGLGIGGKVSNPKTETKHPSQTVIPPMINGIPPSDATGNYEVVKAILGRKYEFTTKPARTSHAMHPQLRFGVNPWVFEGGFGMWSAALEGGGVSAGPEWIRLGSVTGFSHGTDLGGKAKLGASVSFLVDGTSEVTNVIWEDCRCENDP